MQFSENDVKITSPNKSVKSQWCTNSLYSHWFTHFEHQTYFWNVIVSKRRSQSFMRNWTIRSNNVVCGFAACLHVQMSYVGFQCSQLSVFVMSIFWKLKMCYPMKKKIGFTYSHPSVPIKPPLQNSPLPQHNWLESYFREVQLKSKQKLTLNGIQFQNDSSGKVNYQHSAPFLLIK